MKNCHAVNRSIKVTVSRRRRRRGVPTKSIVAKNCYKASGKNWSKKKTRFEEKKNRFHIVFLSAMAKSVATIARRQRAFQQSATNVNLVSTSFQIWNNVNGIAVTTFQYIILYKLVLVSWVFVMKCLDLIRCPILSALSSSSFITVWLLYLYDTLSELIGRRFDISLIEAFLI